MLVAARLACMLIPIAAVVISATAPSQTPSGQATQSAKTRELRAGVLPADLRIDGSLDEAAWQQATAIEGLTTIVPKEGGRPVGRTVVRVLAGPRELVIGVRCEDPAAKGIVSYSVARDSWLGDEDHIKIVLGTFQDGRTGYVFAVNPSGARYDAVVAGRGEYEDFKWDGVWEVRTRRDAEGWTAEIRIPVLSLSFKQGLSRWHFNVERRVQRLLETSRWAGAKRDYSITQTSRAGLLTDLPAFTLGLGLSARPSGVASFGRSGRNVASGFDADASLDVAWRPTSDLTAALTFNTDFAETEVDTRQTNLTRFPLFFPDKRSFFVEGSDAFDFGLGLDRDVLPFHSRRIGLVGGTEVPIQVGGKVTGRLGDTSIGAIALQTGDKTGVAPQTAMAVVRLRQDVLAESSVGLIATTGDPMGRNDSWLGGVDFTYQTSEIFGSRNFLLGVWGMTMNREGLGGSSRTAWGTKIDYPNDLWDIVFVYKRIGADFDPSLGFVPRAGIQKYRFGIDFAPRPDLEWLRQTNYELAGRIVTDLDDHWETYTVEALPLAWKLESGDEVGIVIVAEGDRVDQAFEIAEGVNIPVGQHEWVRYGVGLEAAAKRWLSGEIDYTAGPFYTGHLDTVSAEVKINPVPLLELGVSAEFNRGRLPQGDFKEDVFGLTIGLNFSPDLTLRSFVQYDTESESVGANTRVQWTVTPLSQVFLVLNYNAIRLDPVTNMRGSLRTDSYESIVKVQHEFRF